MTLLLTPFVPLPVRGQRSRTLGELGDGMEDVGDVSAGQRDDEQRGEAGAEERALGGDRDAWNDLVARHQRRVLLSLIARGARIDVAREIAQQAWLAIYETARKGKLDVLELPGLAIRQAEFLLLDRQRREARHEHHVVVEAKQQHGDEPRLFARDALRVVQRVVGECPPGQQRIFWAAYAEQPHLGHVDLAASLGVSVQHLRTTLCEVRHRIRIALEEDRST